jgi:NADPH2:quinone reductase
LLERLPPNFIQQGALMGKRMKAVVATAKGGPEVLVPQQVALDWPAGNRDVLVSLRAAALNPADVWFRKLGGYLEPTGPFILGHDGAGIVEAVGSDVINVKPGDRVCFCHGGLGGAPGTYAEFAIVPAELLTVIPANVDFVTAAALPLVFITLSEALCDRARIAPGETVLIHAGAGGTGHIGVQLARLRGARVATTVSSGRKAKLAHDLGANLVIPYRDRDFVSAAMDWTAGRGLDVALDNVGAEIMLQTFKAMAPYGRVVTLMGMPGDTPETHAYNANLAIHNVMMLTPMWLGLTHRLQAQAAHVREGMGLVADARLRVVVDRVFPLKDAAAAHAYLESGQALGKVALSI